MKHFQNKHLPTKSIVIVTYDLELLGDCNNRIYQVIEELYFLKKNFGKASLLTCKQK